MEAEIHLQKVANLRWWICGLLVLATALNYFDRLGLPVAITELQKDIPISDQIYGRLQFLFLLAYGLMYIGGGRIIDRLGTRSGYALLVLWWSVASALQGTARTVFRLGAYRLALGLGEGGGFPGSAKAVAEWFPAKERSIAFGLFNAGASVGAVLAPPAIALVILVSGWRSAFFLTGALGLLWSVTWLRYYRVPARHPAVTNAEIQFITGDAPPVEINSIPSKAVLKHRQLWGLMLARFLCDAAWYFFIFWLPKYLGDVRHLDIKQIGQFAW